MTELRSNQRITANVVKLDPEDHPDNYLPPQSFAGLEEFGCRGVVKDLFSAPNPVKAYLCKQFALHQTPVFDKGAEKHIDK